MESKASESPDRNAYDNELDENWNERKRLIEREFELRFKVQEALLKAAPTFEQIREEERSCKADLARNDQVYESLILRWSGEIFGTKS